MADKLKDEKLKDAVGGKHIPYNVDETPEETLYSFTAGETIYNTVFTYYIVKQTGSFRYDEDVLCDAYKVSFSGGSELIEQDNYLKAGVLNTYRSNS